MILIIKANSLKLYIRYMVSMRCKMVVKEELKKLGLHFVIVDLGIVDIMENITDEQREQIRTGLHTSGLELMDDKNALLVEKIKNVIIEKIYSEDLLPGKNFSDYLSERLNQSYPSMSGLFTEMHGSTIEQFIISNKIERVKELLIYDKLTLTEIAWKLYYSSVAHLSNQFKKVTGLTPSHFKKLNNKKREMIEEVRDN